MIKVVYPAQHADFSRAVVHPSKAEFVSSIHVTDAFGSHSVIKVMHVAQLRGVQQGASKVSRISFNLFKAILPGAPNNYGQVYGVTLMAIAR